MIDFKEILPLIDLSDFSGGRFNIDYNLPDGRALNIKGYVDVDGYVVADYMNEPLFKGTVEFAVDDWTGYDKSGNEIPVTGSTWFQNYMTNLLNQ